MKRFKLTANDKKLLADWGFLEEDIVQIAYLKYIVTDYTSEMSLEEACDLLGRRHVLGAIGRAVFHVSGNINDSKWSVRSNLL